MPTEQLTLPLGALRNRALFSRHWLENRLALEPEWTELRDEAREVLDSLQRFRVEYSGNRITTMLKPAANVC